MPQLSDALGIFAPNIFRDTMALITGGGRGIGREIALAFARLGANVVIASRNENNLKPTAEDIEAMGGACLAVPTNSTPWSAVDRCLPIRARREPGSST